MLADHFQLVSNRLHIYYNPNSVLFSQIANSHIHKKKQMHKRGILTKRLNQQETVRYGVVIHNLIYKDLLV